LIFKGKKDHMSETQMLTLAGVLVAGLFGVLATIIGWMGSRVITRLDDMVEKLTAVAGELHTRINGLDTRLTRVEVLQEKNGGE
jgi:hypothetical protein